MAHAFLLQVLPPKTSCQFSLQNAKIIMPTSFLEQDVSATQAIILSEESASNAPSTLSGMLT